MKRALLRLADLFGVGRACAWWKRRHLPIVMYHGVVEQPLPMDCWHMLARSEFESQLEWLARRYRVLPLEEALQRLYAGTLPPRSCALTFDDGYANNHDVAFPALRRLGLPATIFLVSGHVGGEDPLWPDRLWLSIAGNGPSHLDLEGWGLGVYALEDARDREGAYVRLVTRLKAVPARRKDEVLRFVEAQRSWPAAPVPQAFRLLDWTQVQALSSSGLVTFGAHTLTHEILSQQEDAEVEAAIRDSHAALCRRLARAPSVFAYPNGRAVDFDARARDAVRKAGIPFALSTVKGLAHLDADPFALPRVSVGRGTPPHRFRLAVAGLTGR
jgi:peptidoglycan/xylan/chitin deacetylase (PgdA/CDA1 family)